MSEAPTDALGRGLRDLRISVTDRCNFRCGYCMPRDVYHDGYTFLPKRDLLSFEEITRLAGHFIALGVKKIRLTGGEPLLRRELPSLVRSLAALPGLEDLTLTTNGHLLADQAGALADAGLRRLTVSLDALNPDTFSRSTGGLGDAERVLRGIEAAEAAGLGPLKINCVVQRSHNEDAILDLARHFRGSGHIVRYIEYMDVGTLNRWEDRDVVTAAEIRDRLSTLSPLEPVAAAYPGEVAQRYRFLDGGGEVGIIASVSQPFCGGCNRARLSSDGRLVTCLFAADGRDLSAPMRKGMPDAALRQLISDTWSKRADRYSEHRAKLRAEQPARLRLEMYQIGG